MSQTSIRRPDALTRARSLQRGARAAAIDDDVGGIDILVNNATVHYDTFEDSLTVDFAIVEEALRTNLLGAPGAWRRPLALGCAAAAGGAS